MGAASERQPNWHINSAAANNRDTGVDAAHPLRDWGELARRLGRGSWLFRQPTTITIAGSLPATDPVYFPAAVTGYGAQLTIQGAAATAVATGTISTFTAFSAAGQTLDTVAVSWLTGGSSFAPYVMKFMRIVGGPRAGVTWGISRDLGSSTAEISNPGLSAPLTPPLQMGYGFTRTIPVAGDTFEIVSLPSAHCGEWSFSLGSTMNTSSALGSVLLTGLSLQWSDTLATINSFSPAGIRGDNIIVNASRCELIACATKVQQLRGMQNIFTDGRSVSGGNVNFQANLQSRGFAGSGAHHFLLSDAIARIDNGEALEGSALTVNAGGSTTIASMRQSRAPFGINLQVGANVFFGSDVWGTANVDEGIKVKSLARAHYQAGLAPSVNAGLGAGREVKLGDLSVLYSDLPMTARGGSMELFAV